MHFVLGFEGLIFDCTTFFSQDTCEEVRGKFMDKLNKGLLRMQLPMYYLSIMVYAGIEPNRTHHAKVQERGRGRVVYLILLLLFLVS